MYLEVLYAGTSIARSSYVNDVTSEKINDGWTRLSVSFLAQANAKHTVRIYNDRLEGIVYADDLQLEAGEAPSNVNLLENGTMDPNAGGWNTNGYGSYANGAMLLQGNPQDNKVQFFQDVPLNLSGEESYILSGWCKAAAVPDDAPTGDYSENEIATLDVRKCGLRAIVIYTDGTVEYHYAPYNPDVTDWQFVSMAVVPREPSKTVERMGVYGVYLKNANTAYFDNLSLVRESASTMKYDEEGNLVSVTSTGLKEETDSYAGGNLIRSMTEGVGLFNYEYDETYTHRLTGVTADWVGLHQGYTHDAFGNVTSTLLESKDGGSRMQATAAYSSDGNRMVKETDSSGSTTEYLYGNKRSEALGAPTVIKGANGNQVSRSYDTYGRLLSVQEHAGSGSAAKKVAGVNYAYSDFRLYQLIRTGADNVTQAYHYGYDDFGNINGLWAGDRKLATYTYSQGSGLLQEAYNGNGDVVSYTYDRLGRVKSKQYGAGTLSYEYNGEGLLYRVSENRGGVISNWEHEYHLRRPSAVTNSLFAYSYEYQDVAGSDNLTTNWIRALYYSGGAGNLGFQYGYDSVGNLTYYLAPEGNTTYTYDARNFLTKAFTASTTYSYTYDGFGNILTASDGTATHTYTYGDGDWKDLLTAYDGKALTYDGAGNPLTYQNGTEWKLTWEEGRRLSAAKSSQGTISYGYDLDGTRRNKTVDGDPLLHLGGRKAPEGICLRQDGCLQSRRYPVLFLRP